MQWHHLHDFRKLIDEGLKSGEDVTRLFKDEEAKIQKIIDKSKRTFKRDIIDGGAKLGFHAIAAAATGGISAIVGAVVAAMGGKHLVDSVIPTIRRRFEESEEIRESRIYYAWKLKSKILSH
jgi:hypothetical protein